jgi:hypothetical protein
MKDYMRMFSTAGITPVEHPLACSSSSGDRRKTSIQKRPAVTHDFRLAT